MQTLGMLPRETAAGEGGSKVSAAHAAIHNVRSAGPVCKWKLSPRAPGKLSWMSESRPAGKATSPPPCGLLPGPRQLLSLQFSEHFLFFPVVNHASCSHTRPAKRAWIQASALGPNPGEMLHVPPGLEPAGGNGSQPRPGVSRGLLFLPVIQRVRARTPSGMAINSFFLLSWPALHVSSCA